MALQIIKHGILWATHLGTSHYSLDSEVKLVGCSCKEEFDIKITACTVEIDQHRPSHPLPTAKTFHNKYTIAKVQQQDVKEHTRTR